jgi:DICT domain-containing protein
VADKALLLPMTQYLERKAADRTEPPVVLVCFQQARHVTPEVARRYADIADTAALVAALATDLPEEPVPGVRGARLDHDDRLRDEWNLIVVGPHIAGALVARDLGDPGPERSRRFEYALTFNRGLVLAAARSLLHRVVRPH